MCQRSSCREIWQQRPQVRRKPATGFIEAPTGPRWIRASMVVTAAVFSVLAASAEPAWPWGGDDHRTIGMVADLLLEGTPTGDKVSGVLGGATLSEASLWADCAKGYCHRAPTAEERAFTDQNPRHHVFHYTDVAVQQPGYRLGAAGTAPDDIVQIATTAIRVLQGRAPNNAPATLNQRSALWLLAHLVGDLHQPLHVGAIYFDNSCEQIVDPNVAGAGQPNFGIGTTLASTRGGNDLKTGSTSSRRNLHGYWDSGTVTGAMRLVDIRDKSIEDFGQEIVENAPPGWQTAGDLETWPM